MTTTDQPPFAEVPIGPVRFRVFPNTRYCETVFRDGAKLPAAPEPTEAYSEHASALGYDRDVNPASLAPEWTMCLEHEFLHSWLAWEVKAEESKVLHAVAANEDLPPDFRAEEAAVHALQALLNGGREGEDDVKALVDWTGLDPAGVTSLLRSAGKVLTELHVVCLSLAGYREAMRR